MRAYPQGEATGDQGWLANIELRYALTPAWQFSTFIDHGEVHLNEDTWDAGDNHRRLSGAGVGVGWNDHGWRISVVSAWKLGSERTESDVNRTPRLWAQLVRYFFKASAPHHRAGSTALAHRSCPQSYARPSEGDTPP
ncbi:hypothetical protein ACFS3C_19440 [Azotobacter vinelandii]